MKLNRLLIQNFRNYEEEEILWHDQTNIICGMNAQGKTNLLEAICYMSLACSFRGAMEAEMLGWEKPYFRIEATVTKEHAPQEELHLSAAYSKEKIRKWQLNGQSAKRLEQVVGKFHTVIFTPDDLSIVKSGPSQRRRFLNKQMVQLYPDYYGLLVQYNHTLKQRNCLLKNWNGARMKEEVLVWNESLAKLGVAIILRRKSTVQKLLPFANALQKEIGGGEELILNYQCGIDLKEINDADSLQQIFLRKLEVGFESDRQRGVTGFGPHRDDLFITINGTSSRLYASQGQQRTAALSLKLAELELAKEEKGEYPVLLLDDVMSELDLLRCQQMVSLLSGKVQTIITTTDNRFDLPEGKLFFVNSGVVTS